MQSISRHQQILRIALPAIVTNITVPLLGLVDTAIVGHMRSAAYIGAIAVGSMIFSLRTARLGSLSCAVMEVSQTLAAGSCRCSCLTMAHTGTDALVHRPHSRRASFGYHLF